MARRDYDPARRGSGGRDFEINEDQNGFDGCCPDCGSWSHTSCGGRASRRGFGTAILGIGVLVVGAVLLLDNLGIMDSEEVIDLWPMLLVLVGVSHFVRPKGSRRYVAGFLFIIVGVVIQLSNLGFIRYDIFDLWPLLLMIAGLSLILKPFRRRGVTIAEDSGVFEVTAILGGSRRSLSAADFRGGDAVAIMGGCDVDLRDCGSEGGPAEIDTFAFWGGIEIKVPEDWDVQVKGIALLGGFGDKTRTIDGGGRKTLIVSGTAIMGGVEIKN